MLDSVKVSQAVKQGDLMKKRSQYKTFKVVAQEYLSEPSKTQTKKDVKSTNIANKLIYGLKHQPKDGETVQSEPNFGDVPVIKIDENTLNEMIRAVRRLPGMRSEFISNAGQNNYCTLYTSVMKFAAERGYLDSFPKWDRLPENRNDFLPSQEQIKTFISELDELRRDMFIFGCATGLRKSNVCLLEIEWLSTNMDFISFPYWAMKNRQPFEKALNQEAKDIIYKYLRLGEKLQDKYSWLDPIKHVFVQDTHRSFNGKSLMGTPMLPSSVTNQQWRDARLRAGITNDLKFHSSRHYMASSLIRLGVPMTVVQKSGGWSDTKSMTRYAHVLTEELKQAADKMPTLLYN